MIKLSPEVKRAVYDKIVSMGNFYGKYADGTSGDDNLNEVNFLKQIWDLPAMPSEDPRFRSAEADAFQHMINNDDWSTEYVFEKRFNLLAGEQKFFERFVELVVSPTVRQDREEIEAYVQAINECLKPDKCQLVVEDFLKGEPVYRLKEGLHHSSFPADIRENEIKVFVDSVPTSYPALILEKFIWDDFGRKTRYRLYYHENQDSYRKLGVLKLMKKGEDETYGKLPTEFFSLSDDHCSLGQDLGYYRTVKSYFGNKYKEILYALKDAACFSKIYDRYKDDPVFKISLLRDKDADTALQFASYELAGFDYEQERTFVFKAKIPYKKEEDLNVKFNFGKIYDEHNLNRIIAVIGNNGIGKTTLLSQMAEALVKDDASRFNPQIPVFSKVIATSYSIFDNFYKVKETSYNYVYCGMQTEGHRLMTEEELAKRRRMSIDLIKHKESGFKRLYRLLSKVIDLDLLNQFFTRETFNEDKFQECHEWLSSGQTMLMNLVIEILAHIRPNSLILIDEPEVHLHPQGITEFVQMIDSLCEDYSSCCVMATHSPLIVQELLSRNIIVMDRADDGSPMIRPMNTESMGENLTTITQDIFGRNKKDLLYVTKIRKLAEEYKTMEEVLRAVQNNGVPVSMSMYLMLDKFLTENDQSKS